MRFFVRWMLPGALALTMSSQAAAQSEPTKPELAVSGVLWGEYAYALRSGDAGHANNIDVRRAYLTFTGKFGDGIGSRVTADINRTSDGSLTYRLKYGYVSYRPSNGPVTYKFGMIQTPYVGHVEDLWDYRPQGSVAADRAGYLTSSDFGVSAEGSWGGEAVTMTAGLYNGEGYNRTPGDKHKDVAGRLSVRLAKSDDASRVGGLRATGFALLGEPNGGGTRQRIAGQLSYRARAFWLAAEVMSTRDRVDTSATPVPTTSGSLISVFGVAKIPDSRVALFGRIDSNDRNTESADDRVNRLIAGVSYQLNPSLRLMADIDHVWYEGGSPTPALDAARSQLLFQFALNF